MAFRTDRSDNAMKGSVYVGFAEALSAPEVVWSLVDAGYRLTAFGRRGQRSSLRHSRHTRVIEISPPEEDSRAALVELSAVLASLPGDSAPRAVMPLDDAAVWLVGNIELPPGWCYAGAGRSCKECLFVSQDLEACISEGGHSPS